MAEKKKILCLDFDGVLHSYSSGWRGADVVSDEPVPGAMAFIARAADVFGVCIFSSRSKEPGGIDAMRTWLEAYFIEWAIDEGGLDDIEAGRILMSISFPPAKPPAFVTIDDRAIAFSGAWPDLADLVEFKTWQGK